MKDRSIEIKVENDELVIRVGISTLAFAASETQDFKPYTEKFNDFHERFKIIDETKFAEGIADFLQVEAEDGTTALMEVFDKAFVHALENDFGVDEA